MYLPNTKYYLIGLETRSHTEDLAAVTKLLADAKLGILSGSGSQGLGGKNGSWEFFVKPENDDISAEEIKKLMQGCPLVLSCRIKESKDGLLVDSLTFPIKLSSGQRALIVRNDVWHSMLQETRKKFGSGGDVIIYDQGIMAGRIAGRELSMALNKEKIVENIEQIVIMYQALGWGNAKISNFHSSPLLLAIRMWDSAECVGQTFTQPAGHFLRGHIVGVTSEVFGFETKCTEVSCAGMGNDFCEFIVETKR